MNLLDQAIAWISPKAGLERARARVVLSNVQQLAYEGAKMKRAAGWTRSGGSANAETAEGMKALRDGARDFVRNNSLASSAMIQFQTKLVGTGIRPQADTGNQRWNELLDDGFEEWARRTKYYAMQSLAARSIPEAGECMLQMRQSRNASLPVPLEFDLLEADHIDHLKSGRNGNNHITQGIEFSETGEEVAVWVFRAHPGDITNPDGRWFRSLQSERIPVRSRNPLEGLVRGFRQDRPEQIRGVSWFAPVMTALWDLSGYEEAERVRKRIEACLAAFVTSPAEAPGDIALGPQNTDGVTGLINEEFGPGVISRLRPGEQVTIAEPKASGGYIDFTRRQDRLIAVGLGLLYELLAGDLSLINYSSYRGGLVGLRDWIEVIQYNLLIPFCCDPVWDRYVTAAKIAGIVPPSASNRVKWCPPYFDFLDREAEAKADQAEMRNGTATWDQTVGRRGYDPTRQAREIANRNFNFDELGIILDCDPRNTAGNGAARVYQQPQQQQSQ